jgi:hypothetical protein
MPALWVKTPVGKILRVTSEFEPVPEITLLP